MKVGYIYDVDVHLSLIRHQLLISVSYLNSKEKYENKYGIGNIHPFPIRLHPHAKPFIPHPFKLSFRLGTKELDVVIFAHRVSRSIQVDMRSASEEGDSISVSLSYADADFFLVVTFFLYT